MLNVELHVSSRCVSIIMIRETQFVNMVQAALDEFLLTCIFAQLACRGIYPKTTGIVGNMIHMYVQVMHATSGCVSSSHMGSNYKFIYQNVLFYIIIYLYKYIRVRL